MWREAFCPNYAYSNRLGEHIYAYAVIDLEAKAWNSTLQNHLQDIKALIVGNVYYISMDHHYRHPNSIFLELRDMTNSWKILPHARGLIFLKPLKIG